MSLSVYIHWPFCISKCPYCSFNSTAHEIDAELFKEYGDCLLKELKLESEDFSNVSIDSIFFGGGTPSLMNPESVANIIDFLSGKCKFCDDIEISLEANPGTFDKDKLRRLKRAGVNRLSLGVQSFSDKNLKFLGRIYDSKRACESAFSVAEIFENFSFDFMYGYEEQEPGSLENDLRKAVEMLCPHISCYQLTLEEGTPFFEKYLNGKINKISENEEVNSYDFIGAILADQGIDQYEVSNYARKGCECRHNLCYWKYGNFFGVGPGAHGRLSVDGKKIARENERDIFNWFDCVKKGEQAPHRKQILTDFEAAEEIFIMGLRLKEGIDLGNVEKKISPDVLNEIVSERKLKFLRQNGLIDEMNSEKRRLKLTPEGFLKIDAIVEFFFDSGDE